MRLFLERMLLTWFGLGKISFAPGTWGSVGAIPLYWFYRNYDFEYLVLLTTLFFAGVYLSSRYSKRVGEKDPSLIVLDEVVGFMVATYFHYFSLLNLVALFVLFRFFDIVKPFPIRKIESVPGGWGIMLDDVLAGFAAAFSWMLLQDVYSWIYALGA